MTSLADQRKAAEVAGLLGGSDIFKVKDGANRIRIVSDALPHPGEFKGKPNFKWLVYVLDRADGQVKPYFMPNRIFRILEDFQSDEEYAFEGMPMPYDVVINAKQAGTIDVEYTVIARKPTALTPAEKEQIENAKPLAEFQQQIVAKNAGSGGTQTPRAPNGEKPFDPDEIPF